MLTRCPHCQTAFRITPEQLTPRQGKVRCGSCRQVFNALESLSDETVLRVPMVPTVPTVPVLAAEREPEMPAEMSAEMSFVPAIAEAPAAALAVLDPVIVPTSWPFPVPQPLPETEPESEPEPKPETAPASASAPEPAAELAPSAASDNAAEIPAPAADDSAPTSDLPEAWTEPVPPPPRRWPWLLGSLPLLVLGALQLTYLYRVELAVLVPELRAPLSAACQLAGCSVPYPHRPELVAIESSDLVPENTRLHLLATLKNRAPFAQELPHLELTLTDTSDQPILRKVLAPRDFLPADKAHAPFGVRDELAVSLWLETPGLQPAGYRLYLFYP